MKNVNFLLSLCICLISSSLLFSQSAYEGAKVADNGKFRIKKIDFSFGFESDYIRNMDANFFLNQMPDVQQARLDELNFEAQDLESMVCENPSINVGLTLVHPKLKNIEWRNAMAFKPNRVDAITYYNRSRYDGNYISINSTHAEFTLESALIYKLPVLSFFNLYGGIGTNLGVTSPNTTCVFTSLDLTATDISYTNVNEVVEGVETRIYDSTGGVPAGQYGSGEGYSECINTGAQLNQRIFLQLGTGIKFFQRVEVGFDVKYGYGYRADLGNSIDNTHIVATNLNLRYILK